MVEKTREGGGECSDRIYVQSRGPAREMSETGAGEKA